jgi:hypothetical protein
MQEFSDSKNGKTDIRLLLYRNQPPQAPPSQKTSTSSSYFTENEVSKAPCTQNEVSQPQLWRIMISSSSSEERRMQKCAEDFEVHWQSKEQNGPTTSNPWNQEQHQEV